MAITISENAHLYSGTSFKEAMEAIEKHKQCNKKMRPINNFMVMYDMGEIMLFSPRSENMMRVDVLSMEQAINLLTQLRRAVGEKKDFGKENIDSSLLT